MTKTFASAGRPWPCLDFGRGQAGRPPLSTRRGHDASFNASRNRGSANSRLEACVPRENRCCRFGCRACSCCSWPCTGCPACCSTTRPAERLWPCPAPATAMEGPQRKRRRVEPAAAADQVPPLPETMAIPNPEDPHQSAPAQSVAMDVKPLRRSRSLPKTDRMLSQCVNHART